MSEKINYKKKVTAIFTKTIDGIKGISVIFIFLSLWELLPRTGIINPTFLPPVSKVFLIWIDLISSGELFKHLFISLQRALSGFALAFLLLFHWGLLLDGIKGLQNLSTLWCRLFGRFQQWHYSQSLLFFLALVKFQKMSWYAGHHCGRSY